MIHKFFCHLPSIISTNCDKSYISITIFICFNINILWNMYHFSKVILETILKWVGKLSLNIPYIGLFYAKIYLMSKFNKESQNSFHFDFFFLIIPNIGKCYPSKQSIYKQIHTFVNPPFLSNLLNVMVADLSWISFVLYHITKGDSHMPSHGLNYLFCPLNPISIIFIIILPQ